MIQTLMDEDAAVWNIIAYSQQEVAGMKARHISNAARINIVKILERWTTRRRLQLHQGRRRLRAAQNESESSLRTMKKLIAQGNESEKLIKVG